MRILLLNDNPVVRKLVALSAQKTKDDLDVIWSLDEIEHPHYDLLIVDDALYSDEMISQLKEKVSFRSSALMATRGAATPAGFDKIINKPFLPTDLVELFAGIAQSLPELSVNEGKKSTDVIDDLLDDDDLLSNDLIEDDSLLKTTVLDFQEVQELQDLLDDDFTDNEDNEFDSILFNTPDIAMIEDLDDLDDLEVAKESLEDELLDDEIGAMFLSGNVNNETPKEDEMDLEALLVDMSAEELSDEPLSDDDFEDLEQQIQEAMGNLELEDLEQPLAAGGLDDLDFDTLGDGLSDDVLGKLDTNILDLLDEEELKTEDDEPIQEDKSLGILNDDETNPFEDKEMDSTKKEEIESLEDLTAIESIVEDDDFDSLDERDIRIAIGEEVDEEIDVSVNDSEDKPLEVVSTLELDESDITEPQELDETLPAVGIEALQSLLKALSNDEVAKSLKGLNISININFGNDK